MKKCTLFLCAMLLSMTSMAAVNFTFTSAESQTKDGFTVTVAKGKGQSEPAYNTTDQVLRMYANNTITVQGSQITSLSVKFVKTRKDYASVSANTGNYVSGGTSTDQDDYKVDTWSGDASEVVITLGGSGQRGLVELTINGESSGDTPATGTEITGLKGADVLYVPNEEYGDWWGIDMYASIDEVEYMYMSPYLYLETNEVYGKTKLNGTYNLMYAEYWKNENEDDVMYSETITEGFVGKLTIKNTDNDGNYSFSGSFIGMDNKTYTVNQVLPVEAFEYVYYEDTEEVEYVSLALSEDGDTPGDSGETPEDMITCTEAASIAAADNYKGTADVTVYGYVVELGKQKTDDKTGRPKQCFYMSDTKDGSKQFMAYWAFVPEFFKVGEQVAVTGILQNYKGTIEIADGEAKRLASTAVDNVAVENKPTKRIQNGQLMIIRGDKVYNVLGAQL